MADPWGRDYTALPMSNPPTAESTLATRDTGTMDAATAELETNPFAAVNHYFDIGATAAGVSEDLRLLLKTPYREMRVEVPVRMDDGTLKVFIGDVEDRNRRRSLWRRERRHSSRPAGNESARAARHDAPLHLEHLLHHWNQSGYPGTRHEH